MALGSNDRIVSPSVVKMALYMIASSTLSLIRYNRSYINLHITFPLYNLLQVITTYVLLESYYRYK